MTILTVVGLIFIAVLLWVITVSMWLYAAKTSPSRELKKRLRKLVVKDDMRIPDTLRAEIMGEMSPLDGYLYRIGILRRLDGLIDKAGLKVDVKIFALIIILAMLVAWMIGLMLLKRPLVAAVLVPLGGAAPIVYLRVNKDRRIRQFTDQFPGALDMIGRSLRAGHAFSASVQMVGNEMGEPVSGLFKTVYEEQTLGLSVKDALAHMSERMPTLDMKFFVAAVNIHRDIGGNLAELLDRLSSTIRQRTAIRRQVKVYTAQARLSGYILAVLPIVMAVIIYFMSPDYIKELTSVKTGRIAIAAALVFQVIGFLMIRRIINIKI